MTCCILIVDDSAAIRRILRDALERECGFEVCGEAVNGQDALEQARQLNPHLIVLDLSMPVMNGLEAAREFKRISPTIPLVMFTSFETPNLKAEALRAGCSALVSKSDVPLLLSSIHLLLEPLT
jgi:DNA-binding NarL/FixJ family response regulator